MAHLAPISERARRRAVARTPAYRPDPIRAGHCEDGYAVLYRVAIGCPSWCWLLVVPSEEESE